MTTSDIPVAAIIGLLILAVAWEIMKPRAATWHNCKTCGIPYREDESSARMADFFCKRGCEIEYLALMER